MKKELCDSVIITDALNGEHIVTIDIDRWSWDTVQCLLSDIAKLDFYDLQHGLLIKYGMK